MKLCLSCGSQFEDQLSACPSDGTPLVASGGGSIIGAIIDDRYRIDAVIGRGSMGVVYKAWQQLVGRPVAVKILHSHLISDEHSIERFQKQAQAACRLKHPNIITVLDYGLLPNGLPYIAMDYLEGVTLSQVIYERKLLAVRELLPIFKQVTEALAEAHHAGVVHGNITPDNIILVEQSGRKDFVKVVDFGIGGLVSNETFSAASKPTLNALYRSPEQLTNLDVDARSDIYSLGIVLFECLTGRPPFGAMDQAELVFEQLSEKTPTLRDARPDILFAKELEDVVAKAIARNPSNRHTSMKQLWEELLLAGNKVSGSFLASHLMEEIDTIHKQGAPKPPSREEVADLFRAHVEERTKKIAEYKQMREEVDAEQKKHLERQRDKSLKIRTEVSVFSRVVAYVQIILPVIICIVLLAAIIWVIRTEPILSAIFSESKHVVPQSEIDQLINQGKVHQAIELLEERKRSGKMSSSDFEILNRLYIRLAKHLIQYKDYQQAKTVLLKVSPRASVYSQAQSLTKKLE